MTDFTPADQAAYRFWATEFVRFDDLDPVGHANSKSFATYIETARVAYFDARHLRDNFAERALAVVRLEIDYLRELHYGASLRVGIRPARLGRSSLTLASAIFDGDACASTSVTTVVRFDVLTRKSVPFSDEERRLLEADL
jgi:acyl-CoA thioester hydrolase